ncbi:MAG: hypothetical protein HFJ58_01115 [Clostridia bacterium]|nr:hypothetical protein [Clostridia bacterium]
MSAFSEKEKRNYRLKKHIKDHLFEYLLDIVGPLLFTMLLLYICKAENYIYGICLSIAYSCGKVFYNLYYYKKEHIDLDVK